nr:OmpH family outer membrane protein [Cytophagales bacterium]
MKKISNVIAILGITSALFAACGPSSGPADAGAENADGDITISDLRIAYIHTDSVINKFDFFIAKSEEIAEKGKKYEGELASRARGFEQEVANFQSSANTMTINQARAKEEELVQKERNLVTYRDNVMQELSADENKLYNEVYDMIQTYLKDYAKEQNLEMILSYTRGGGVWYADSALDITSSVISGINADLKAKQNSIAPAATPKEDAPVTPGN